MTGWKNTSTRRKQLPKNWPQLRAQILARDDHTCQIQAPGCTIKATDVDHIQRGNNHDPTNLRAACHHCHMVRTGHDGGKTRRRPKRAYRQPQTHPAYIH